MNHIIVPRALLHALVVMAGDHVQDIESGLSDGTYDKADNADIGQKQGFLAQAEALLAPPESASSVDVAHWEMHARTEDGLVQTTHSIDIADQRVSNGQAYMDVAAKEGNVGDMLCIIAEVNTDPLVTGQHVPCVHVSFDGDNRAFSAFKIGNDILLRPESGVELTPFSQNNASFYWVK